MTNNDRWRTAEESDFTWSRASNDTYTLTISSSLGSLRTDDQYQFLAVYDDGTNWTGYYEIV